MTVRIGEVCAWEWRALGATSYSEYGSCHVDLVRLLIVLFFGKQRTAISNQLKPTFDSFVRTDFRVTQRAGERKHPPAEHGRQLGVDAQVESR